MIIKKKPPKPVKRRYTCIGAGMDGCGSAHASIRTAARCCWDERKRLKITVSLRQPALIGGMGTLTREEEHDFEEWMAGEGRP